MLKKYTLFLLILLTFLLLFGCSSSDQESEDSSVPSIVLDQAAVEQEAKALQTTLQPAQSLVIKPEPSGKAVEENQYACTFRFSEIIHLEDQPGLHFKIPFLDTVWCSI